MAILEMFVATDNSNYDYRTTLEGDTYTLSYYYNAREGAWYFDVLDVNDDPVVSGSRLTGGSSPLLRNKKNNRPPGDFLPYSTAGDLADPDRDTFGDTVLFFYIESTT